MSSDADAFPMLACDKPKPHEAHWLHVDRDGDTVTMRGLCDGQPEPEPPIIWTLPESVRPRVK